MQFRRHHAFVFAILALVACNTGGKNGTKTTEADARVTLVDGRVSFIPPANLKQLTKEQIAASKFGKGKPPDYLFANETQTVSIGVVLNFIELAPDQLPEYLDANKRLLTMAIDKVQFLAEEIVNMNGRDWVHFEVKSDAPDIDLHNHQYSTSFNGGALVFGFNSTVKEYDQYKDAFMKSAETITVKD